jgi:hypothetical protein
VSLVLSDTPVEEYLCAGVPVLVKREDLCSPAPGPQFSKIRGLYPHLLNRPEKHIGILDTFHSKAGWATSYVCNALGKTAIVFYPQYKADWEINTADGVFRGGPGQLRPQQMHAQYFGAQLVPMPATAGYILEIRAKKLLTSWPDSAMLPVGLKMPESVAENAKEAELTATKLEPLGSLVVSASSGTVAAGVIRGFSLARRTIQRTIVHLGYSRPIEGKKGLRANMEHKAQMTLPHVEFVDEKYSYREAADGPDAPFKCNPYYDLKAWRWLESVAADLPKPILFWNVGA